MFTISVHKTFSEPILGSVSGTFDKNLSKVFGFGVLKFGNGCDMIELSIKSMLFIKKQKG